MLFNIDQGRRLVNIEPIQSGDRQLALALAAAKLPVDDLTNSGREFYRFAVDGRTVGYGGLECFGDVALLRSVVVLPEFRGRRLGAELVDLLLQEAGKQNVRTVYLLTETATAFFEHQGFSKADRASAPTAIMQTRQAASLCPASATLLMRTLNG